MTSLSVFSLACVLAASVPALRLQESDMPDGWYRSGPREAFPMYDVRLDREVKSNGAASLRIRSTSALQDPYGTVLTQRFSAQDYRGKRVQLAGSARADGITGWAGLWLRIDGPENQQHDNMSDRPIKGTIDWQRFTLVLDVPPSATFIYIGAVTNGRGTLWLDDFEFKVVDPSVPTTGRSSNNTNRGAVPENLPRAPRNLGFESPLSGRLLPGDRDGRMVTPSQP